LIHDKDLRKLQGVMTKCLFEAQHKDIFEKNVDEDTRDWLGQQLISDVATDAEMEGIEKLDDYEIDEEDIRAAMDEYDKEHYSHYSKGDDEEEEKEEDVPYDNKETL